MKRSMLAPFPKTSALILAGGEGERLLPLTASRPKPVIPFGGVFRIIDFTLANCLESDVTDVSVLTQYRYDELHRYVRLEWSDAWDRSNGHLLCLPPASGKRYRGTADAVFQNLPVIKPHQAECVLVLSSDHVYNMNYGDLLQRHAESGADLTIMVKEHPIDKASQFGIVEVDHDLKVKSFTEKPKTPRSLPQRPDTALISMGIYVFRAELLEQALRDHCESGFGYDFGRDIIPALIQSANVRAFKFSDAKTQQPAYWRDIGTIDSYYDASMDLVGPMPVFNPYERSGYTPAGLSDLVHEEAVVTQSVVSPDVRIAVGAHIQDSVLMAGVQIGHDAKVRRAIIEEGVHIPSGFHIGWDLDQDRKHYPVSSAGVVVVNESPRVSRPTLIFASAGKKKPLSQTPSKAAA